MLSKEEIIKIYKEEDLKILKSLGQNFLIDEKVLEKIVGCSDLKSDDVVFEIGPGLGTLTKELFGRCKKVVAIEKDKKLAELLEGEVSRWLHSPDRAVEPFVQSDSANLTHPQPLSRGELSKHNQNIKNVEIINDDILKIKLEEFIKTYSEKGKYKLVSNIPYYITSPIIKLFLESDVQPEIIVLLMQKEVAERICAKPGKLSILALSVQIYGEPEIIDYVDKSSFYPEPKVDSAILKIKNINRDAMNCVSTKDLFRIIKIGFSSKRKKLANNFSAGLQIDKKKSEELLLKAGIALKARAQELGLEDWKRLVVLLKDSKI